MGRRKTRNIFWGILFLLGALALLLGKLGFLINGILRRSFGGILFSLAMLIIINDELLHMEAITPWPVLGAALLGTIGLHFLFPGRR